MRDHLSEIQHARRIVDLLRRALLHGDHVGEEFAEAVDRLNEAVATARASRRFEDPMWRDLLDTISAPQLDGDGR